MSDAIASQSTLDPDRPWITDEQQLPNRMNWLDTLFNPTGKSPTLHFTRAWTFLFMAQFIMWFGIGGLLTMVLGVVGTDMSGIQVVETYAIALTFVITTLMSYVIHVRRFNDAGRSPLWAIIVLIPLLVSLAQFGGTLMGKSAEYDQAYERRAEFIADPAAFREKQLERQREAREKAAAQREERQEVPEMCKADGGRGGPPGGFRGQRGGDPGRALQPKEEFILRPAVAGVTQPIIFLSIPIAIWTLLWVARAPLNGAQYPQRGLFGILLSFKGRISRLQYWSGIAAVLAGLGGVAALNAILSAVLPPAALLAMALGVFMLFCGVAVTTKRAHDLGKSIMFMVWPWAVTLGAALLAGVVIFLNMEAFQYAQTCGGQPPLPVTVAFLVSGVSVVCAHLGFLFLMGTSEPEMIDNAYGAAPNPGETGPQYPSEESAPRGYESGAY